MLEQIQALGNNNSSKKYLLLIIGTILFLGIFIYSFLNSFKQEPIITNLPKEEKLIVEEFLYIDIAGAVDVPGVYEMEASSRVIDAIERAGGITTLANHEWVTRELNLSSKLSDSQKIYIPFEWETREGRELQVAVFTDTEVEKEGSINVNQATSKELESLNGVGAVYAQKIIDNRVYANMNEFKEKSGLSESLISKIQDEIKF